MQYKDLDCPPPGSDVHPADLDRDPEQLDRDPDNIDDHFKKACDPDQEELDR